MSKLFSLIFCYRSCAHAGDSDYETEIKRLGSIKVGEKKDILP